MKVVAVSGIQAQVAVNKNNIFAMNPMFFCNKYLSTNQKLSNLLGHFGCRMTFLYFRWWREVCVCGGGGGVCVCVCGGVTNVKLSP